MDTQLYTVDVSNPLDLSNEAILQVQPQLESGRVIYFPTYAFNPLPHEQVLFSEKILDNGHKNISFDAMTKRVGGLSQSGLDATTPDTVQGFMQRFADFAKQLMDTIAPSYSSHLIWGRTSYRPAEVKGRKTSRRKDDTRLHVDAFPSTPVNGLRILRVFCNINPYHEPRVWHLGEPFPKVLNKFASTLPPFRPLHSKFLLWIKATKTIRSAYDHYMLHLHDQMKLNDVYQESVRKERVNFPSQSTWIVFTDQVSHAALSGQFLLEQTFYLPMSAMLKPECAPFSMLKKLMAANVGSRVQLNV